MASEGTLETARVCASHPTGWRAGWRGASGVGRMEGVSTDSVAESKGGSEVAIFFKTADK